MNTSRYKQSYLSNDILIKAINTVGRENINGIIDNLQRKAGTQLNTNPSSPRSKADKNQKIAAIIHRPDEDGFSPLHYAVKSHRVDFVEALLHCGADINVQDKEDAWTPLMWASTIGDIDVINCLLKNNADLWIPDTQGATVLHQAVLYRHTEVIKLLLNHDIKLLDQGDSYGMTPLMWACDEENVEAITLLLDHNANIDISDNSGKKAIDVCETLELQQIIKVHAYNLKNKSMGGKNHSEESKSFTKAFTKGKNSRSITQQHNRSQTSVEFDIKHHKKILGLPITDEDENIDVEDLYDQSLRANSNTEKNNTNRNTQIPWSKLYLVIGASITISSVLSSVIVAYMFQNKLLDKGALRNSARNLFSNFKSVILKTMKK